MWPIISVKSDMDELAKWAKVVAVDQVPFATSLALNMTGQDVKAEFEKVMPSVFDRPTPYTMKGFQLKPSTKTNLQARVGFKEDARQYLAPEVYGGTRPAKAVERALQAIGALPSGWVVVPGQGAKLDQYGNVDRGQIVQVLSQLRITMTAGYSRNMSFDARKQIAAQRKAGGRFFVAKPGGHLHPGVYQRELIGKNITPVLMFVHASTYKTRLPLQEIGERVVAERLGLNFGVAWQRALASARR